MTIQLNFLKKAAEYHGGLQSSCASRDDIRYEKIAFVNIYTKWFSLPCLLAIILIASSPASVFGAKKDDEKAGAVLFRDKGCA